jgi:cytochrome P450
VSAELPSYPFTIEDPLRLPSEFRRLRDDDPVTQVRLATGDTVWLVTRYSDVRDVLADRRFSRNLARQDAARLIPGVPQLSSPFSDPPAHTRWRKLVSKAFTPRQVERLRPEVARTVDSLLDGIAASPQPVDLVGHFATPLPILTICMLLGVEPDQHRPFRECADTAMAIGDADGGDRSSAFERMQELAAELVERRRADPGEDLLSRLITVHDEDEGALSQQELIATIMTVLIGGYESTVNQLARGLVALFDHPEQLAALRADPGLIPGAVEEILRYAATDSGYGAPRYATEDVEVGGVLVPKGSTLLVIRQSAHRDEEVFDAPDTFDISRANAQQHFAFGGGPHFCLGAALVRLELDVAYRKLLERFDDLRLAVPVEQLTWHFRVTTAGPDTVPVLWTPTLASTTDHEEQPA